MGLRGCMMEFLIVLGDGAVSVDGVMVKGSRVAAHDLDHLVTDDELSAREALAAPADYKLCCCRHHAVAVPGSSGYMPLDQFGEDRHSRDHTRGWCNACRAYDRRMQYARGREVRPRRSPRRFTINTMTGAQEVQT